MNKCKYGILGFGRQGEKAALALQASRHCELSAIGTSSRSKFNVLQNRFPNSIICSYEELIRLSELDVIFIALPNSQHTTWILNSLKESKHVLCEKPLCVSASELLTIRDELSHTDQSFHLGFMYRFHPQHLWVKKFIEEQHIGKPYLFEGHFHYHLENLQDIRLCAELGGGGLLDVGCYLIDCVDFLFDSKAKKISGNWNMCESSGTDLSTHLQFVYENGLTAHFTCGTNLPRENYYRILGSNGSLLVRHAFRIAANQKTSVEWRSLNGSCEQIQFDAVDQLQLQFEAFADKIMQRRLQEDLRFTNGLNNMELLLRAREACLEGSNVSLRK